MYNLWIWEGKSWRMLSRYPTRQEAVEAGRRGADEPDAWIVAKAGGPTDERIRQRCTERLAPYF